MKPFGEVIQSSLQSILGQSWQWNHMPAFGSLIAIQGSKRTIFGLIYQLETGSMDSGRYPFPYQKTHEELLAEQPQIFEFLKTTFTCLPLGYQEKGQIYYLTPPEPALIHSFIASISAESTREFFAKNTYLHTLFTANLPNFDDLLLAILKQQKELNILHEKKINEFIHTFSLLTGNDYRRLKLFLQRAQTLI